MTITLRPYQSDLEAAARKALARVRRVLVQLPTGGGKSAILSSVASKAAAKNKTVWILAHRRKLITQLSDTVSRWGVEHGIIQSGKSRTDHAVQVGSIDTVIRRLDQYPAPDLIIIDEGHHVAAGNKWGRVIDAYPNAYVISLTATPERLDGKGLGEGKGGYMQALVCGPTVEWLTANGFLAESVTYSWPIRFSERPKSRAGDYAPESAAKIVDKPAIMGDAIAAYRKHLDGKTAIANCCTIAHAESVAASFNEAGIAAAAVTGKTDKAEQDRLFAALESGELKILCQCELISEGLDLPSVSGALMLRPTQSIVVWLQQLGRALRPKPDGSKAIILDFVGNALKLGLPSEKREWTLDGKSKRPKDAVALKVCKECYAANPVTAQECQCCGHEFEVKSAKEIATIDGTLRELAPKGMRPGDAVTTTFSKGTFYVASHPEEGQLIISRNRTAAIEIHKGTMDREMLTAAFVVPVASLSPIIGTPPRASKGAQTYEDLVRIGKERGFKPGWASHVWRSRQLRSFS